MKNVGARKKPNHKTRDEVQNQERPQSHARVKIDNHRRQNQKRNAVWSQMRPISVQQRGKNDAPQAKRFARIDAPIAQIEVRPPLKKMNQPQQNDENKGRQKTLPKADWRFWRWWTIDFEHFYWYFSLKKTFQSR